ncbi:unnamed protein product [Strongylus vulgaris]|uniref:Uncharacterized protein n=1 Tax=Strongylus vulgaris TaxID=40348 RepID=A0A3P7JFC5_STRVU|nr:unnamed protein product [Strongylus vulgaris]
MNGLKAIMNYCEKQARPVSKTSTETTMVTAVTRSGSSSSVSTGRDALTREVLHLKEAMAGMNLASRAAAGRNRDEMLDSFAKEEL